MSAEQKQEKMLATIKKHERLIELAKKLNSFGKITEVIFTTLSDIVNSSEKIFLVYYQMQMGTKYLESGETIPDLYSCELTVLTNQNFIKLNFLKTAHTIFIRNVDNIAELSIQSIFGSRYDVDDEIYAEEHSFKPSQLKVSYVFNNARGEKVATWDIDTMDEQNINMLLGQTKSLTQYVGLPLSKI